MEVDHTVREAYDWLGRGGAVSAGELRKVCDDFKLGGEWVRSVAGSLEFDAFNELFSNDGEQLVAADSFSPLSPLVQHDAIPDATSPIVTPKGLPNTSPIPAVRETLLFNSNWPRANPHGGYVGDFRDFEVEHHRKVKVADHTTQNMPQTVEKQREEKPLNERVVVEVKKKAVRKKKEQKCGRAAMVREEMSQRVVLAIKEAEKGVLEDDIHYEGVRWRLDDDDSTDRSSVSGSGCAGDVDVSTCQSTGSVFSQVNMPYSLYPADFSQASTTSTDSLLDNFETIALHPVQHLVHTVPPPPTQPPPRPDLRKKNPPTTRQPFTASESILNVKRVHQAKARLVEKVRSAISRSCPGNAWLARSVHGSRCLPQHVVDYLEEEPMCAKHAPRKVRPKTPNVTPLVWYKPRRTTVVSSKYRPAPRPKPLSHPPWDNTTHTTTKQQCKPCPVAFSSPPPPLEPVKTPTKPSPPWAEASDETKNILRQAIQNGLGQINEPFNKG